MIVCKNISFSMFGTYRTEPKMVEFMNEGIKLTNVSANKKDCKFKYHIMIPFIEMQELLYCSDINANILLIKPTIDSNEKIQEAMQLGKYSWNGLKFDVQSEDSREHYIIVVFNGDMNPNCFETMAQFSKSFNPKMRFESVSVDFAKLSLSMARVYEKVKIEPSVQTLIDRRSRGETTLDLNSVKIEPTLD